MRVRKTNEEIMMELAKLHELKDRVREYTGFGDNNREAIRAQIQVLEEHETDDDVYSQYDGPDDHADQHLLDNALSAIRWRDGEGDSLADDWVDLVQED